MKEKDYQSLINERANNLFEVMRQRVSEADMIRIQDAFNLALEAHAPQRRKSGEPYIFHPIAVATIVAKELELGANPVIAALLHDVVEDIEDFTFDDLRSLNFNEEIITLVNIVTNDKTKKIMDKQDQTKIKGKKVYLTFDDGPSKNTEKILDTLKENNVKATFFVIGRTDDY